MTQLLVSVRDADEATTALVSGAHLIDVKEPQRGSLGAADLETVEAIVRVVNERVSVSVALGELLEIDATAFARVPRGVRYAKVGLAGCANVCDWAAHWQQCLEHLPSDVIPVAVVYADQMAAAAPPAHSIIREAARLHCGAVLVDTWQKRAGNLLDHWSVQQVHEFVSDVGSQGMLSVVAGSLTIASLGTILPTRPDVIAVRGAACQGDRTGKIVGMKVEQLRAMLVERRQITTV
jgi:uncharacterized protein (UPF0264 family)